MNDSTVSAETTLMAEFVKQYRLRQHNLGMNDDQLSEKSGVSKPVLSALRAGKKPGVQLSTMERIAAALDMKITISLTEIEAQG